MLRCLFFWIFTHISETPSWNSVFPQGDPYKSTLILYQLKTLLTAERNRNIDLSVRIEDALKQYETAKQRLKQAEQWKSKYENLRKENAQSQLMSNLVASSQKSLQEKITRSENWRIRKELAILKHSAQSFFY